MSHTVIRSKMRKTQPLMGDPIISRYVPETDWFNAASLYRMLQTYSTVYIKPDVGRKGDGVIRIRKLSGSECEVSYRQTSLRCASKNLIWELNKIRNANKKYIIQRGIDLATYHNRPFDVRVVLQKPLNRWHLSWMSAKVAPRTGSVVTNVAKGAKDVTLIKALRGIDQSVNVHSVLRELIDVSYQIVQILGSKFPLSIVGLDMAIDKKGNIWFVEANTKPDFTGLGKLDRNQYERYLAAKRLIDKG
ncbi:MAG: YheC/YheD family protein [Alicyclobacillus sp.]|nr:YheC/YheD family protein [Alicyclobacillus sp.]